MTQESAPHFFDESDGQKLRIHTISTYLNWVCRPSIRRLLRL